MTVTGTTTAPTADLTVDQILAMRSLGGAERPQWSPDGTQIAFVSGLGGGPGTLGGGCRERPADAPDRRDGRRRASRDLPAAVVPGWQHDRLRLGQDRRG